MTVLARTMSTLLSTIVLVIGQQLAMIDISAGSLECCEWFSGWTTVVSIRVYGNSGAYYK